MLNIEPGNAILGATVTGVDLAYPLSDGDFACVLRALGRAHVPPFTGNPVSVRKGLSW